MATYNARDISKAAEVGISCESMADKVAIALHWSRGFQSDHMGPGIPRPLISAASIF